jgi:hypothetical protein
MAQRQTWLVTRTSGLRKCRIVRDGAALVPVCRSGGNEAGVDEQFRCTSIIYDHSPTVTELSPSVWVVVQSVISFILSPHAARDKVVVA